MLSEQRHAVQLLASHRLVPEGWYPDPMGFKQLRWWGGEAWTEHVTQPVTAAAATSTAAVSSAVSNTALSNRAVSNTAASNTAASNTAAMNTAAVNTAESAAPLSFVPRIVTPARSPAPLLTRREQREQRSRDEQFANPTGQFDSIQLPPVDAARPAAEPATGPVAQPDARPAAEPAAQPDAGPDAGPAAEHNAEQSVDAAPAFTYKPRSLAFSLLHTGIHTSPLRNPEEIADEFAGDEQEEALYLPRSARSSVSGSAAQSIQLDRTLRTTDPGPGAPGLSTTGLTLGGRSYGQPLPTLALSHADAVALAAQAYTQSAFLPRASVSPVYTWPIWVIALVPVIQLLASLIVLLQFGATPKGWANGVIMGSVFALVVALAIVDRALLKRMGFDKRSTWVWSLLGAPVYLVSRSIALFRTGRAGLAPPLVWAFVALLQVGCFVVAPGILIAALPVNFSLQAEKSVVSDASILGLTLRVVCPEVPPTMIGERFVCNTTDSNSNTANVTVSLQRQNGWIGWHVDDWGVYKESK